MEKLSLDSNEVLPPVIRNVTSEDYPAVCRLFEEGDALHRHALPNLFRQVLPPRTKEFVEGFIGNDNAPMLVAVSGTELIGLVHFHVVAIPDRPVMVSRTYMAVDTLIVGKNYRQRGVGQALMHRVHQWAEAKGIHEIELNVYAFNQEAIDFYKKLGYETLYHRMKICH